MMPVPVMNIARPLGPSPKRVASTLENEGAKVDVKRAGDGEGN
jgi:hypothetical protein